MPASVIEDGMGLKTISALRLSQMVIPGMKAQKWGRIVFIAGAAGTSPESNNLAVSFANITMLNLSRGLQTEFAGDGILVNTICPGGVNTPRTWARQAARAEREGKTVPQLLAENGSHLPAGRICEPERDRQGRHIPVVRGLQLRPRLGHLYGWWREEGYTLDFSRRPDT